MPRPDNNELTTAYMRDLEIEIQTNTEEIANGRTDLQDYDLRCRNELAILKYAQEHGTTIGVDRYGIPSLLAGKDNEIEALKLIRAVIAN